MSPPLDKKTLLTRGVIFSYGATAVQVFYSFATIPLALAHLPKAEFGMWTVVLTLTSYLTMVEMGMTNAFMRHLFDCKDGTNPEKYGRLFLASSIALLVVSVVIFVLGIIASLVAGPWLRIPPELQRTFAIVLVCNTALIACSIATRMLGAPLYVHHRQDIGQVAQIGLFVTYFVVLYYGFKAGWGIYSMLINQLVGFFWFVPFCYYHCAKRGFYPKLCHLRLPHKDEMLSVWSYTRDQFIMHLGGMIILGLPQILTTRLLGLEAAAVWAVCTRPFSILRQIVQKPFDVALPMLCDLYVRKEPRNLAKRWTDISQLVLVTSVCVFAVAAANNERFIGLWTAGKIHWHYSSDWFTAFFFLASGLASLSFGTVGISKKFGRTRYVPFVQAILTVALAIPSAYVWGLNGLLLATALSYLCGQTVAGIRYLANLTGTKATDLFFKAFSRPLLFAPLAVGIALGCKLLTNLLPNYLGFVLSAGSGFGICMLAASYLGVSPELRQDLIGYMTKPFQRIFRLKNSVPSA